MNDVNHLKYLILILQKLFGDRFSSTVKEILHLAKLIKANVSLENISINEVEKRNSLP